MSHRPTTRMTRRQLLRLAGAAGMATAWGSTGRVPAAFAAAAAAMPKPVRGGTLQVALAADPAGLNPWRNVSIISIMPVAPCYNGIVTTDTTTWKNVVGDLAESWTVSPDGKTYTFTMRRGNIRWHDGQPLTIDDIVYSLQTMGKPVPGTDNTMIETMQNVASADALSASTFRIVLKQPDADFLTELTEEYAMILPKHILQTGADLNTTVVGTGPYKLQEYRPGAYLDIVRNPDYGVHPGLPYFDGIRFTIVPDRATRLAAVATGRVDTLGRSGPEWLTGQEVAQIQSQNHDAKKWPVPSLLGYHIMMNSKKPPFNDVRVRKAAFLAPDRQLAVKVIAKGDGMLPGFFPPGWGISAADLAQLPGYRQSKDQDLTDAKALLKAAGYANGLPFTILTRVQSSTLEGAQFAAQQLSAVGFQPTIKPVDDAQFWDTGAKGDHQAMVFTPGTSFPINDFGRVITANGRLNFTGQDADPVDPRPVDEAGSRVERRQAERLPAADRAALVHRAVRHRADGMGRAVLRQLASGAELPPGRRPLGAQLGRLVVDEVARPARRPHVGEDARGGHAVSTAHRRDARGGPADHQPGGEGAAALLLADDEGRHPPVGVHDRRREPAVAG